MNLTHKGYGRIYVDNTENIQRVKDIIKEMDAFEYDYLPKELITVFTDYPQVTYVHKFSDMDMEKLTARCWAEGVHIWVFDSGHTEYPKP